MRVENTHEADYLRSMCSDRYRSRLPTDADGMQGRHNADFFRAGKMCGLRLVAGLWREQAEQQPRMATIIVASTDRALRQCSMHYIRYDVLYAYVLSRLQYWSGLAQQDEEQTSETAAQRQLIRNRQLCKEEAGSRTEKGREAESRS